MDNQITYLDFTGDLTLDTARSATKDWLNAFITKYQKRILLKLLGEHCYLDMEAHIAESKYVTLLTNSSGYYTKSDDKKYIFEGIKEIITCYVFYYFSEAKKTFDSTAGEVQVSSDNKESELLANRRIRAWNRMIELYDQAIDYINYQNEVTADTFPDFDYESLEETNSWGL